MEVYKNVKYLLTTHTVANMPQDNVPEIAIVGKSNVGKSSLINLVSNNKKMAHISGSPGKTRGISLFEVEGRFRLVDLPGYGFAKVSKSQLKMFGQMMEEYFLKRSNLEKVILLIDIRRSFGDEDMEMISFLINHEIPFKVIGTKLDKVNQSTLHKFKKDAKDKLGITPLTISVLTKKNVNLLRDYIE